MSAPTKTDICNLALSLIGNDAIQITNFDTDGGVSARQCRLHYQRTLEELLRLHTWNCSKKRAQPTETVPSITDSSDVEFTYSATLNGKAEFRPTADDQSIRWSSANSRWEYGTWSDPTFTATFTNPSTDNVPPETGWFAVTTGTLSLTQNYGFGFDRAHLLPTDSIRPLLLTNNSSSSNYLKIGIDWSVETGLILSNYSDLYLLYLGEPSLANMDSLFIQAFYTFLASKLAIPITGNIQLSNALVNQFMNAVMPEARRVNSFEGSTHPVVDSEFLEATFSSNGGWTSGWMANTVGNTSLTGY